MIAIAVKLIIYDAITSLLVGSTPNNDAPMKNAKNNNNKL